MVLPFERQTWLQQRYTTLYPPQSTDDQFLPHIKKEKQTGPFPGGSPDEYASFLKALAGGMRVDDELTVKIPKPPQKKSIRSDQESKEAQAGSQSSTLPEKKPDGVITVTLTAQQNDKLHQKRMRIIEDHMLQHKQEERELKRYEGDIIKKQRQLRRAMTDYENNVYRKRRKEEMKLGEVAMEVEKVKQQASLQEEKITKDRIERNRSADQVNKDKSRKAVLVSSGLEFQYEKIAHQLQLKRVEVANLTKEFEDRLKLKEQEEFRLKKELADLAINLNMETQKKKTVVVEDDRKTKDVALKVIKDDQKREKGLEEKLGKTANSGLKFEYNKRRLSRDLQAQREVISEKKRDEGRKMTDALRRLQLNSMGQKNAQQNAQYLQLDRKGKEITEKIQMVDARKNAMIENAVREKREQSAQQMTLWKKRIVEKQNEEKRRIHQDSIRHLQKSVTKQEETEHSLYNRVRGAEAQHRKHEQTCQKTAQELEQIKKENARKLKEAALQFQKSEEELKQKLLRQQAELAKVLYERETCIQDLYRQRLLVRQEKELLEGEEKEHDRLTRIGQRTDEMSDDQETILTH